MSHDLLPAAGEVVAENLDSPASIQCVGSTSLGSGGLQSLVLAQIHLSGVATSMVASFAIIYI